MDICYTADIEEDVEARGGADEEEELADIQFYEEALLAVAVCDTAIGMMIPGPRGAALFALIRSWSSYTDRSAPAPTATSDTGSKGLQTKKISKFKIVLKTQSKQSRMLTVTFLSRFYQLLRNTRYCVWNFFWRTPPPPPF